MKITCFTKPIKSRRILFVILPLFFLVTACSKSSDSTGSSNETLVKFDQLDSYDTAFWQKSDSWANGAPFMNGWCGDAISFSNGTMQINLTQQDCAGKSFGSGEFRSVD
ncbi:MAG: hypothetical protein R3240_07920, partial [Gammaproteobacteria bacterium]|nr:hypothetical protein [Gammaproteobacteria bacterium]